MRASGRPRPPTLLRVHSSVVNLARIANCYEPSGLSQKRSEVERVIVSVETQRSRHSHPLVIIDRATVERKTHELSAFTIATSDDSHSRQNVRRVHIKLFIGAFQQHRVHPILWRNDD